MREIEFRGKAKHNNKWYFGDLNYHESRKEHYILEDFGSFPAPIQDETVGQYTGRKDKNGIKLYEGDIFTLGDPNIKHIVVWHDNGFMGRQEGTKGSMVGLTYWEDRIEIIGNVHDEKENNAI